MKVLKIMSALLVVFALAGTAWAHFPAGTVYFAVQFPDELLPTIDGDHSDWDIVPDAYRITMADMFELVATGGKQGVDSEAYDLSDFNVNTILGWNESANRLYTMVSVFDDIHQRAGPGVDRLEDQPHDQDENKTPPEPVGQQSIHPVGPGPM